MCDTIVAVGGETADGAVIFGKNSDRDPNEVQNLIHLPRSEDKHEFVKTTYIEIPQLKETFEVFLSQPFWMWGAEMGINEFGVTIGNEAVFTKEPLEKQALLGMDLVRLGLERSRTAEEALSNITTLLEKFGQGGECGYTRKVTYHNSFIIADPTQAWLLETVGRYWIAEKVRSLRTISNCLTIESEYDKIHPELISHTIEKGYCKDDSSFNFRKNYSTAYMLWAAKGDKRRACTLKELSKHRGELTIKHFMETLRSHNESENTFSPRKSSMASPCLHASSFKTPSQSTASQITSLSPEYQINWATGTSGTCTSVFRPFILGGGIYPLDDYQGAKNFTEKSLWWKHERIHRKILSDYQFYISQIKRNLQIFEEQALKDIESQIFENPSKQDIFHSTMEYFEQSIALEDELFDKLTKKSPNKKLFSLNLYKKRYNRYWNNWNKKAKLII